MFSLSNIYTRAAQSTVSMAETTAAGNAGPTIRSSGTMHNTGAFPHLSIARVMAEDDRPLNSEIGLCLRLTIRLSRRPAASVGLR